MKYVDNEIKQIYMYVIELIYKKEKWNREREDGRRLSANDPDYHNRI